MPAAMMTSSGFFIRLLLFRGGFPYPAFILAHLCGKCKGRAEFWENSTKFPFVFTKTESSGFLCIFDLLSLFSIIFGRLFVFFLVRFRRFGNFRRDSRPEGRFRFRSESDFLPFIFVFYCFSMFSVSSSFASRCVPLFSRKISKRGLKCERKCGIIYGNKK